MKPPPTCNFVIDPRTVKLCGKTAVAMIHAAGYCAEHLKQAERLFGESKAIFREELFER